MDAERRIGKSSIPEKPAFFLNSQQIAGIRILRKFGWKLDFVRRPVFSDVTPVLRNIRDNSLGILEIDGILKISSDIKTRKTFREPSINMALGELPTEIEITDTATGMYGYPSLFNSHFLN